MFSRTALNCPVVSSSIMSCSFLSHLSCLVLHCGVLLCSSIYCLFDCRAFCPAPLCLILHILHILTRLVWKYHVMFEPHCSVPYPDHVLLCPLLCCLFLIMSHPSLSCPIQSFTGLTSVVCCRTLSSLAPWCPVPSLFGVPKVSSALFSCVTLLFEHDR